MFAFDAGGRDVSMSVEQNKIKRSGIGVRALDRTRAFPGFTLFAPLTANGVVI